MRILLILTLLLSGCASWTQPYYKWEKVRLPAEYRTWTKVAKLSEAPFTCNGHSNQACTRTFVNMCDTYSIHDEEEAKRATDWDGMTIYDHEIKHCEGWAHQ